METNFCEADPGRPCEPVETGHSEVVCRKCGVVMETVFDCRGPRILQGQESRRCADVSSEQATLSTTIANAPTDRVASSAPSRKVISRTQAADSADVANVEKLSVLSSELHLTDRIRATARSLQLAWLSSVRGKKGEVLGDAMISAMIYLACRNEGGPRSFSEISRDTGIPRRDIIVAFKGLEGALPAELTKVAVVHPSGLIGRICERLGLPFSIESRAVRVAEEIGKLAEGRRPSTVAAVAVFLVCATLCGPFTRTETEVASASMIFCSTIRSLVREISTPQLRDFIVGVCRGAC